MKKRLRKSDQKMNRHNLNMYMNKTLINIDDIDKYHPIDHIKDTVFIILAQAQKQIQLKQSVVNFAHRHLQHFDKYSDQLDQLSLISTQDNITHNHQQPKSLNSQFAIPEQSKSKFRLSQLKKIDNTDKQNSKTSRYHIDHYQQQQCLRNHSQFVQKLKNNEKEVVYLNLNLNLSSNQRRLSQDQDYSNQIQELLRRKKELLLSRSGRQSQVRDQNGLGWNGKKRNLSKNWCYYDYDGQKMEVVNKKRNFTTKIQDDSCTYYIKALPRLQILQNTSNLKKKGPIEIAKGKMNMKKKQFESTFQILSNVDENQFKRTDLNNLISAKAKQSKGVKLSQLSTKSIQNLKFPLVK